MNYVLLLIPFIAAFIGWIVVKIALRIMIGNAVAQKQQLAVSLGNMIDEDVFSFADLTGKITNSDNLQKIMPVIDEHIDHFLKVKLKQSMPVVGMFVGEKTIAQLKAVFLTELESLFPVIMNNYIQHLQNDFDVKKIITSKIEEIPVAKFERALQQLISPQQKTIEGAGAIMGFIIGIITVLITYFAVL